MPFLGLIDHDKKQKSKFLREKTPENFDILLDQTIFREPENPSKLHPITIKIMSGSTILIYNKDDNFRNMMLASFTSNKFLSEFDDCGKIEIGGTNIEEIRLDCLKSMVGVVLPANFYISGTLRDNILYKSSADEE